MPTVVITHIITNAIIGRVFKSRLKLKESIIGINATITAEKTHGNDKIISDRAGVSISSMFNMFIASYLNCTPYSVVIKSIKALATIDVAGLKSISNSSDSSFPSSRSVIIFY